METMPDIQVGDIFDEVAPEQHSTASISSAGTVSEWDANGKPLPSNPAYWTVVGKPVQPTIDPQGTVQLVPIDQVNAALAAGSQGVVAVFAHDGIERWIPGDKVKSAIRNGGKFADPVSLA
jgi:hypothetical protein